ncbi:unnamed protein product [Urochloa decumbens]|uniref:F-box domain-containing protein n=1 Tax=Urochloa decumbens TaxID=240449 RepID=A0ABC8YCW7_9POAL
MTTAGRELPDDLIADVLRRLPPRSLAVSRCVCTAWRGLVDARRLLRVDLLPRSVGGIFLNYCVLYSPEFLSRPTAGPTISGDLEFVPGFSKVVDHCNGLLLVEGTSRGHDYVCNPATRRWARLPPCPVPRTGNFCYRIKCLAYDPTVSPHFEVFLIPSLPHPSSHPQPQSEWPPSSYELQVFSSKTGCWEERSFVLEGGHLEEWVFVPEGGRVVDKLYWREELYVLCEIGSVLRISMSNAKYRMVPKPSDAECEHHGCLCLGRSEKGVYCAFNHDWHGLRIFLLNESAGGQLQWELKHIVDFRSFARKLLAREDYSQQHKGPWMLQDINYYKYPYGNSKHKEPVKDKFEWNSDDDDVLNTEDIVEGSYVGYAHFIGFHPYKEIAFLDMGLTRAVAYHWNTSKFQDLGSIYPKDYHEIAGHVAEIETSFIYTPCWMEDFPQNNLEAQIEDQHK